jgi:amino acid adenylation domain-containing protein
MPALQGFRISPQQLHVWLLSAAAPQTAQPYRAVTAIRIDGCLDIGALRLALALMVARHEILRTSFHLAPGMSVPLQVVGEPAVPPLAFYGLETLPKDQRWSQVDLLFEAMVRRPHDLAHAVPLQAALAQVASEQFVLVLGLPALCADGAAMQSLVGELATCYGAGRRNGGPPATDDTMQYAELAAWQAGLLEAEETEGGRQYWGGKGLLARAVQSLPRARNGEEPAALPFSPRRRALPLPEGLLAALGEFGERIAGADATAIDALLAAWAVLLWRRLGEPQDLVIAVGCDGRRFPELVAAQGPFVRYLPLVLEPRAAPFIELMAAIAGQRQEAMEYLECFSWEALVETAGGPEQGPFCSFGFDFADRSAEAVTPLARFAVHRHADCSERFHLKLSCVRDGGPDRLEFHYDASIYDEATVERLVAGLERLLAAVVDDPEALINRLPAAGEEERRRLLEFNPAPTAASPFPSIHAWIESQVAHTPEAVAVRHEDEALSYGELNTRANGLAYRLRRLGMGPERCVAILLERGCDLVVAILGVLKAGAAYIPLDPGFPRERLWQVLEDASLVLTSRRLEVPLPGGAPRLDLEDLGPLAAAEAENPPALALPEHPAYIIYTSGSTGRPKGVVVTHSGLVHSTAARLAFYRLPVRRFLLVSSIAFDSSVAGLFGTLCQGGELLLPREGLQLDPQALAEWMTTVLPSHLLALPSLYAMVRERLPPAALEALGTVILAGEACPRELVRDDPELRPSGELFNEYGPTEATVWTTVADLREESLEPRVPIGRPIANTRVFLLDPCLDLVPVGTPGELTIGGAGLARGYHGRSDLTAERFVPDPCAGVTGEAGGRLYRSGDLARYRPDGCLEFLGRIDYQVKIRGFRIEIEEIEAALGGHPKARAAAVVAVGEGGGEKRLYAYLVPREGEALTVAVLREYLEPRLAEYMIPSRFFALDELPLTPTGKLDRTALASGDHGRPLSAGRQHVGPATPQEMTMAAIWAEVLHLDRVSVEDSFFELGGDSIRSVQVVAKAEEHGLRISVQDIFQYRTIAALRPLLATSGGVAPTPESEPFSLIVATDRDRLGDEVEDAYPLARLQAGMLFHMDLLPGTAIYLDLLSAHLQARFDEAVLRTVTTELIDRHPMLRTSFHLGGFSQPLQVVWRHAEPSLVVEDLRLMPPAEQESLLAAWLDEERCRHIDWERPPLMRLTIHRRAEDSFQFTLLHPHAILDGWSAASLLHELFGAYLARVEGRPAALPAAPRALYRDYIALEQAALGSETAREFWRQWLAGSAHSPLATSLAPAEESRTAPGERFHRVDVPSEVGSRLHEIARDLGVPPKSVLLAAHVKVLSMLSGSPDVVTGLVTNGRPEMVDGERVLGLFLNTLPLRLRLPSGSWWDLIRETVAREQEMMAFRWYPMEEVQRLHGGQPLFDTAFNFIHFHVLRELSAHPGLRLLDEGEGYGETNFTLFVDFSVAVDSQEISLQLEIDTSIVDAGQAALWSGYFQRTLATIACDPDSPADAFVPLSPAEVRQVLVEWNETATYDGLKAPAYRLFEQQAARAPERPAAVCDSSTLTYDELNRRANRLARRLRRYGVGPEAVVGIVMERSLSLLVSVLAVWKAGGAYLPLSPESPSERLSLMAADAGARLVLADAGVPPDVAGPGATLLYLAQLETELQQEGDSNLEDAPTGDHLAYVIYTSGSTGKAKGVMVGHRAYVKTLACYREGYGLADWLACHLQMANFSFDVFAADLARAWGYGGTLVVCPREILLDPEQLYALMLRWRVDCAEFVPIVLRYLTSYLEQTGHRLDFMRLLVAGSDSWYAGEYRRIRELCGPQTRLINSYGLTEAAIDSTFFEAGQLTPTGHGLVPIGRPMGDTKVYLLDTAMQPVPIGVAAELHVGGERLARGYLGRPDLTAERFVPDPWSGVPGARLYKTGDICRHRQDGNIEFMGRADHQVKVRGVRVELGEVEATLGAHSEVRQAVAGMGGGQWEGKLIAWVVPKGEAPLGAAELRAFLQRWLPEAMIPSSFVFLDRLPLTANGKVDRGALPSPGGEPAAGEARPTLPGTPIEEMVATIWSEVLGVTRIGSDDSFFLLGGHSLLATQVMSRLRQAFVVELPLRDLFEAPVLAGFAGRVEQALRQETAADPPPIERAPRDAELSLSFAQQRLWFIDQLQPGLAFYNIGTAFRLSGELDIRALHASLQEIGCRHAALRTVFRAAEGVPAQVILPPLPMPLPMVDLSGLPPAEQQRKLVAYLAAEQERPFDLAAGPLWRAMLLRLAGDEHVIALTTHHIVSDGWSERVLMGELAALYPALAAGLPSPLPELTVQYADYALWQRQWLTGEVLERQLGYWRQQLSGLPPLLELPTDRPRPAIQTTHGAVLALRLPHALTTDLAALGRRAGVTQFMVLLAGLQVLLAHTTGSHDIAVGTPIAGRGRRELEGLIGFFVNTLVLRTSLSGNPTVSHLLRRVREVALGAYAHQDIPFEKLVDDLAPARSLSYSPLFQVMLVLQNVPQEAVALPALAATPLTLAGQSAKFDLTVTCEEIDGELNAWLEYNTDLFDATTIERLGGHFQRLLAGLTGDAEQQVGKLPWLSAEELQQLAEWNEEPGPPTMVECIHQWFEAVARSCPERTAAICGGEELTYAELDARSARLASELRRHGVGPEVRVGLFVEPSLAAAVAILGVLKAGGVYVPLDPSYPTERVSFMLTDAAPAIVITCPPVAERLPWQGSQVLTLSTGGDIDPEAAPESEPHDADAMIADGEGMSAAADHPAYIIYTSGSTGRPKGVVLPHRALVNLVAWHIGELLGGRRTLQLAPLSFDVSFYEMFVCWCSGGELVIAGESLRRDLPALARHLRQARVEKAVLPVAVLQHLAEIYGGQPDEALPPLRELTTTGEQMRITDEVMALLERLPGCGLHNHYGPSETHVVTSYRLGPEPRAWPHRPPIGRPITRSRIRVLDLALRPVPVGVVGEIYLGGDCLARGYAGRPELTAERFVPDPEAAAPGERLYRTGDRGRFLPDGNVEYLGRLDDQVKVRGFRVEPGEIESALSTLEGVREAVVVVRQADEGKAFLIAYIVGEEPAPPSVGEVRAALVQRLPEHMIPSHFVFLEKLPLTANRKVDRRALPLPDGSRPDLAAAFVAPRTAAEEVVVAIWRHLLQLAEVGVDDNFFELGGHSLLATQVLARVQRVFQVELPLRPLFQRPTVAGLVEVVAEMAGGAEVAEEIARTYLEIEQMSEDEVRTLLSQELA